MHAVLCAAGYNLRWLLRAIARKGLKGLFAPILWLLVVAVWLVSRFDENRNHAVMPAR